MYVSDDNNFANPKLAPNSSSDVKIIETTFYAGIDGIGFASFVENIDCNRTNLSRKIVSVMVVRIYSKRGSTFGKQFVIFLRIAFSLYLRTKG